MLRLATYRRRAAHSPPGTEQVPITDHVRLTPSTLNLEPPNTAQLLAEMIDQFGDVLAGTWTWTWQSSVPAKATVDSSGLVTAVAAGSTTITVTNVETGLQATCAATITNPQAAVDHVNDSPASLTLVVGGSTGLATADPEDASNNDLPGRVVTWASDTPSVATVGTPGYSSVVTPVAAGSALIRPTCEGVQGAQIPVTVTTPPPPGTWLNEPAGFAQQFLSYYGSVTEDGFVMTVNPNRVQAILPSAIAGGHGTQSLPSPLVSPSGKLWEGDCPTSQSLGTGPYNGNKVFAVIGNQLFMAEWVRVDTAFDGREPDGSNGVSKHFHWAEIASGNQQYNKVTTGAPGSPWTLAPTFQACARGSGIVGVQDMTSAGSAAFTLKTGLARDTWYFYVRRFKMNSADGAWDGEFEAWIYTEAGYLTQTALGHVLRTHCGYTGSNTNLGKPFGSKWNRAKDNPTCTSWGDQSIHNPADYKHHRALAYASTFN